MIKHVALLLACILPTKFALAAPNDSLYQQIKQLDTELFAAFNRCDIDALASMYSKQLEFYHDTAGLDNYAQSIAASKTLCEKRALVFYVTNQGWRIAMLFFHLVNLKTPMVLLLY